MGSHLKMGFLAARVLLTYLLPLWTYRKTTKESLAQTSSAITESLMGISRMMSQQVQQSEEAMQTLGKARPGDRSFSQSPCSDTCHQDLPPLPLSTASSPSLLTCVASHFFDSVVLPRVGCVALTSLFGFVVVLEDLHSPVKMLPSRSTPRASCEKQNSQAFSWKVGASRVGGGA